MSIRKLQTERVLADISRLLYSEGVQPTSSEVFRQASEFFSEFPPGKPMPMDLNLLEDDSTSNPDTFNELMARLLVNLGFLYEASQEQVAEVMELTTELRDTIKRLNDRRRRVEAVVDDYLLSIYNSDGYFLSVSDTFADLSLVDLGMTEAYVDLSSGKATLPMVSNLSSRLTADKFFEPTIEVQVNGITQPHITTGVPFSNAVDGLTNTFWTFEVETTRPAEVACSIRIPILPYPQVSRLELDPYGTSEAQWSAWVGARAPGSTASQRVPFGGKVVTTRDKFSFANEAIVCDAIILRVIKKVPDYRRREGTTEHCRYIFGLKDLAVSYQVYDQSAWLVSEPLTIPTELSSDMVIDAVSLVTDAVVPDGSSLKFYVAEDTGGDSRDDFDWRPIDPVGSGDNGDKVIHFNGAERKVRAITDEPTGSDLQRIAPDSINDDLTKRNPSPSIIPGADVYRLAEFDDDALPNSMRLDEGVNMVRIYHRPLNEEPHDLVWWIDRAEEAQVSHARIDVGNEFFYGGDVGESNRTVYVETYVELLDSQPPLLAEMKKADDNSQTWKVTAFLNGREVGSLPVGTNKTVVPWTFQKGLNHVVVLIDIPAPTTTVPNPYVGTLDLLGDSDLFDHGFVRLDSWQYTDPFHMQWNQLPDASVFTIKDDEIITYKEPTGNYRFSYSRGTESGPSALRIAAQFTRESQYSTTTPELNQYRLRFSYG